MITEDKTVDAEEEKKKAETVDKNVTVCTTTNIKIMTWNFAGQSRNCSTRSFVLHSLSNILYNLQHFLLGYFS